jgi:hypothetical protein
LRIIILISLFFSCYLVQAQNYNLLRGYVVDENAEPLVGVVIRVQNTNEGTVTNEKGQYELRLIEGFHRLYFSFIGYETQIVELAIQKNEVLNLTLLNNDEQLKAIEVSNKKRDLSYEIIQKVSENRDKYQNQFITQKRSIYVKSVEENTNSKIGKIKKKEEEDPFAEKKNDSIPNLNLFEADFVQHIQLPNGFKEEKLAAKKLGSQRSLFFTSTTDADFDFTQNLILAKSLGDNSYISPISSTAILGYKYKLLGSRFVDNKKVYTIKIVPRKSGNALFEGEIEVWDSLFVLKSVDLKVSDNSLITYDKFSLKQSYAFVNEKWVIDEQHFTWNVKGGKSLTEGSCYVKYTNYTFDTTYAKRFFNAEVGITKQDAYEKDTSFWEQIRPIPLTEKERIFITYEDSMYRVRNSTEYLDSVDAIFNKITFLKITLNGIGHIDREKKEQWNFDPLISVIDPVAIGGWRVRYSISYFKRFESRKSIFVSPMLNYGFRNQDVKGNLNVRYLYNPKKLSVVSLNTGRYFGFVNNFATINDVFRRSNFYQQTHAYLYHRTELFNGFYAVTGIQHLQREDLGDFKFASTGDSLFANNKPIVFPSHTAFETVISIEYTPKQLYLQEPKEKIVLGSKFPTFSLLYKQAFTDVFGSNTDYKFLEFSAKQLFNVGTFGTSEYNVVAGAYLDTTNLKVMDYRYIRGGDPYFFLPAMYGFQLVDSTFPVFKPYIEGHYVHQFNGFITSKIPGLKQLNVTTMVGAGALWVPERNYQYTELFGGINRIFKIGKERIRLGCYYVVSQSNAQGFRTGFKFSIEPYNPDTNTWSF